jgi:hypothetical protein
MVCPGDGQREVYQRTEMYRYTSVTRMKGLTTPGEASRDLVMPVKALR